MTLKEIKPTDPDYHKPIEELIEDLGHAEPANQHGDVIITVEDLTDALHYLKEYLDKMVNDEEAYKRGYSCGYKKAKEDEAESRRWDESYRASQMPWNHGYCEMGG